jgi:hypothetical protein
MANAQLSTTLAQFTGSLHRTKNRLLAIPADVQRRLGLARQPENDILLISIRKDGKGRWNHHYVKLTFDNEFAIPSDVASLQPGDPVEVKVHGVYAGTPKPPSTTTRPSGAALLLALASEERPGFRSDGATRVDEYLNEEIRERSRLR